VSGRETPVGAVPEEAELDLRGLTLSEADLSELLSVDPKRWEREMHERTGHLAQFGGLPTEISAAHERAVHRFGALP
jgi:phosphoenolpyruvate carboxykinase (GTP)